MKKYKVYYIISYMNRNINVSSLHSDTLESDSCNNVIDFVQSINHYKHLPTFQLWKQLGSPKLDIIIKSVDFA